MPKGFPFQILGGKTVKYVQYDPHTTDILLKQLNVTLFVSEGVSESVSDTLDREKLGF